MGWNSEERDGQTERVQIGNGQRSLEHFSGLEGEAGYLLHEIAVACSSLWCDRALFRVPVSSKERGDRDRSQELGLGIGQAWIWLLALSLDLLEWHFLIYKMGLGILSALISKGYRSFHIHCNIICHSQNIKQSFVSFSRPMDKENVRLYIMYGIPLYIIY